MNTRAALHLWPTLDTAARLVAAEEARPQMVELARGIGARTSQEIRSALELVAAACHAELDDAPAPALNRAQRRAKR